MQIALNRDEYHNESDIDSYAFMIAGAKFMVNTRTMLFSSYYGDSPIQCDKLEILPDDVLYIEVNNG
jgi:hypothetical protein